MVPEKIQPVNSILKRRLSIIKPQASASEMLRIKMENVKNEKLKKVQMYVNSDARKTLLEIQNAH